MGHNPHRPPPKTRYACQTATCRGNMPCDVCKAEMTITILRGLDKSNVKDELARLLTVQSGLALTNDEKKRAARREALGTALADLEAAYMRGIAAELKKAWANVVTVQRTYAEKKAEEGEPKCNSTSTSSRKKGRTART